MQWRDVFVVGRRWGLWVGLCLLASAASAQVQRDTLRIATGELPPYATQSRADQGLSLAIVRQALRREGLEVEFSFMPWGRAQEETKAGTWDATAAWGKRADRERDFLLSDNVLTEQWVVLHRSAINLDWQRPEDLTGLRVAAIKTYTYTPELLAMMADGRLRVDWSPDALASLRKLAAGRVDIVFLDRQVGCVLIDRYFTPAEALGIRAHPRLITDHFTSHVMLPRDKPESAERLLRINRGLAALRASGEWQALVNANQCQLPGDAQARSPRLTPPRRPAASRSDAAAGQSPAAS